MTRRRFVAATGAALAGAALPFARPARAARAASVAVDADVAVRAFLTRPDLTPPAVTIATRTDAATPGLVFTAPFTGPGQHGPLIFDDSGEPVWFKPVSKATAMNFRVQRYRDAPVLTWWEGQVDNGGYGGGTGVVVDRTYREIARVKAGPRLQSDLHEFVLTSRGTALIAIYSAITADLTSVGGPADGRLIEGVVQEIDIPSGRVLFEWHSFDHVGLDESNRGYPTEPGQFDYFHLNSIGVDRDGHLLVSARHTSTVYKVHRRTGAVIWRLGGKRNDFRLGPGAAFSFQHDARSHDDGTLTVFDNGASSPADDVEGMSRPVRLALDSSAMTATLAQVYPIDPPRLAIAMGNVQQLPDGGAFVGWGTAGGCTEIGPDGSLRFDSRFTGNGWSYRALRHTWVGRPRIKPTVVTAADTATGGTTVHVSWNGATDVAAWQIRAGARRDGLAVVRTVARSGFETAATVPQLTGYVAVTGLDGSGRALGSSVPRSVV